MHFRIKGKRDKLLFVPVHAMAQILIEEYLVARRPLRRCRRARVLPGDQQSHQGAGESAQYPNSIYRDIVQKYGLETGASARQSPGMGRPHECVHDVPL
jgi:hypothetical protein